MGQLSKFLAIAAISLLVFSCLNSSELTFPYINHGNHGHQDNHANHGPDSTEIFMRRGESVNIERRITIAFLGVDSDSRCPFGADCVWAGDAAVRLKIADRQIQQQLILHTTLSPDSFVSEIYTIKLDSLRPYPKIGMQIRPDDYIVWLKIKKN